ncbi:ACP S-malonyltransferase [Glaciecola petra]|uniref:Malonyl CoA-acyl carrier protein transacylase n=1 Tax=Glaciecola petra TaxID=3075602 RepID=A0ABU2ZNX3_9ALTE|nr:ACP S-malonyltransferase [Aestuariibacter sp. P117]MDT0594333.1 ACP S-malonyltransferase [Aestuariibacter sp. P117]
MSKLACVFPGQGSQSTGMLAELAQNFSMVGETFEQASDALGYDVWDVVQNDETGKLGQTEITQPALLTASIACWKVLNSEKEIKADFLAGHSLGEYTALVAAGVLSLDAGVKLVEARGQFMQLAVAPGDGAMYAIIGLEDDKVEKICAQIAEQTKLVVSPVNYNSPGQIVIAGAKQATDLAAIAIKEAGAKRALPLAVSVPSHCSLMKSASQKLESLLSAVQFAEPIIPIINNVDVSINTVPAAIKDALVRQLYMPVQWTKTVQVLAREGVTDIYEVGPGKVLTGLIKRIDKSLSAKSMNTPQDF